MIYPSVNMLTGQHEKYSTKYDLFVPMEEKFIT